MIVFRLSPRSLTNRLPQLGKIGLNSISGGSAFAEKALIPVLLQPCCPQTRKAETIYGPLPAEELFHR